MFYFIISYADRKKDLVKLQGGEYVAVGQVETVLKMVPIVEQIYIHADSNHEFTVVFIVPSTKHLEDLAESLGVSGELEDLCKDKKMESEVLKKLTESGIKGENWWVISRDKYMMEVRRIYFGIKKVPLSIWIYVGQQLEDSDDTILGGMIINGTHIAYGKIENS